jgi:hypothetical protein
MKINIETFKKTLLEEIKSEVNRKQGIPINFISIELEEVSEGKFQGVLWCQERSPRKWTIPLLAEIIGNEVRWNANDLEWYGFEIIPIKKN